MGVNLAQNFISSIQGFIYPQNSIVETIKDIESGKVNLKVLETAIKQGNLKEIASVVKQIDFDQPLPSGQLPLHLAVLENQKSVVELFLQNEANPEIRDHQNLSAIDHAVLMQHKDILATVLAFKIGRTVKTVEAQIQHSGTTVAVNNIIEKVRVLANKDRFNMGVGFNQAAYCGHIHEVERYPLRMAIVPDSAGECPLQSAVYGAKKNVLEHFVNKGLDLKTARDSQGKPLGLLHIAATVQSEEMLNYLLDQGLDPNEKNEFGQTPLHFAAATDNFKVIKLLLERGANPEIVDRNDISPLAIIGSTAYQRDPLALPASQVIMFLSASAFWGANLAMRFGVLSQEELLMALMAIGLGQLSFSISSFVLMMKDLKSVGLKLLAVFCEFGLAAIPGVDIAYTTWKTYHIGSAIFSGLKACWNNAGYRNWMVGRNVVVHSVNAAHTSYIGYLVAYPKIISTMIAWHGYMGNIDAQDQWIRTQQIWEGLRVEDENTYYEKPQDTSTCSRPSIDEFKSMSNVDRVLQECLDPNKTEDAQTILSAEFDPSLGSDKTYLSKTYKDLMRNLKVDQVNGKINADDFSSAQQRINAAYTKLKG